MPNALPHKPAQVKNAAGLAADARSVGLRCLATATLRLAQRSSEDLMARPIGTSRDLRADPAFAQALEDDLAASEEAVMELLLEAMEEGLTDELTHLASQIKGIKFTINSADRQIIASCPIQGHTAAEMSASMHQQLRYEVTGLVASTAYTDAATQSLPQLLGATVTRFGDRVAGAVEEAFYAGVQLAARLTAQAVVRAG